jgi:trehalose synthase-fused probable maltokinase
MNAATRQMTLELRDLLPEQLAPFLLEQRWFGGKARKIQHVDVADIVPMEFDGTDSVLLIVRVNYAEGGDERYAIPLIAAEKMSSDMDGSAALVKLRRHSDGVELLLSDALKNERFLTSLLKSIYKQTRFNGEKGELHSVLMSGLNHLDSSSATEWKPKVLTGEQSNSSVVYGDRLILKFFRRMEPGINPEVEIGSFLTEKARFAHSPALIAWVEYRTAEGERVTQAVLQSFVPNEGDAWRYTLKCVTRFYDVARQFPPDAARAAASNPFADEVTEPPEIAREVVGPYMELAGLLGRRTAQLHRALASNSEDDAFAPEPFTTQFQRNMKESRCELTERILSQLRSKVPTLPAELRQRASDLVGRKNEIARRFEAMLAKPMEAFRTRIHGDYHLGQVLYTGCDFVIIDFEGEPARPLAERRSKQSPLQDVAGMLRSFHYAAFAPLLGAASEQTPSGTYVSGMEDWADGWYAWVASHFLAEYFSASRGARYLPPDREQANQLLQVFLLEKAIYELGYELNNRPGWVGIPLEGIRRILSADG